jgi:CRP-like cAMP-binding protein
MPSSKKFQKYLAYYQQVLREEPENVEARLRLAAIFREIGQKGRAIDEYVQASRQLAREGLPLEAIAACKAILELEPTHTDTQLFLARLFAQVPEATGEASRIARPLEGSLGTLPRRTPHDTPMLGRMTSDGTSDDPDSSRDRPITLQRAKSDEYSAPSESELARVLGEQIDERRASSEEGGASTPGDARDGAAETDEFERRVADRGSGDTDTEDRSRAFDETAPTGSFEPVGAREVTDDTSALDGESEGDAVADEELERTDRIEPDDDEIPPLRQADGYETGERPALGAEVPAELRETVADDLTASDLARLSSWIDEERPSGRVTNGDGAHEVPTRVAGPTTGDEALEATVERRPQWPAAEESEEPVDDEDLRQTNDLSLERGELGELREMARASRRRERHPDSDAPTRQQWFESASTTEVRAQLPDIPLLGNLAPEIFAALIERLDLHEVPAGAVILEPGHPRRSLFIIVRGSVEVRRPTEAGDTVRLATLGEGEFFGEFGLLTGRTGSAVVQAGSELELLELRQEVLRELARHDPSILDVLWDFYHDRLISNLMATNPLFARLESEERQALGEYFDVRRASSGEVLFGDEIPCRHLCLIASGSVELEYRAGAHSESMTLQEGQFFGVLGDDGGDRDETLYCRVTEGATLLCLPQEAFQICLEHSPEMEEEVQRAMHEHDFGPARILTGSTSYVDTGVTQTTQT